MDGCWLLVDCCWLMVVVAAVVCVVAVVFAVGGGSGVVGVGVVVAASPAPFYAMSRSVFSSFGGLSRCVSLFLLLLVVMHFPMFPEEPRLQSIPGMIGKQQ